MITNLNRLSLKKLPNTLILHLKRFEFDFETMQRVKLCNLFEFPIDLDMEPYTTNGIARAEAKVKKEADSTEGLPGEGFFLVPPSFYFQKTSD